MNTTKQLHYILDGHTPVPEPDVTKWKAWMRDNNKSVRYDRATVRFNGKNVGIVIVSTVFLGHNHNLNDEDNNPLLFETVVLGGPLDGETDRCFTWEAAEKMHEAMCERVKRIGSRL